MAEARLTCWGRLGCRYLLGELSFENRRIRAAQVEGFELALNPQPQADAEFRRRPCDVIFAQAGVNVVRTASGKMGSACEREGREG